MKSLIERLKKTRDIDLGCYKISSLERRIELHLKRYNFASTEKLIERLDNDPAEYDRLINTIFVNYSEFFRTPDMFQYLSENILPGLISQPSLRIWCSSCAAGEEVYSLAIILDELDAYKKLRDNLRIFATDVDEDALQKARTGVYSPLFLNNVSEKRLSIYFEQKGNNYKIDTRLRKYIVFGVHDITKDVPIGKLDMIICRNVLIYLEKSVQELIFKKLQYALNPGGVLVIGKSETLRPDARDNFSKIEFKLKIFGRNVQQNA